MQAEQPTEPEEPKPAAKEPEEPKPAQDHDISRVLLFARIGLVLIVLFSQLWLWSLFATKRGTVSIYGVP
jgi:hypothetical protein